MTDDFDDAPQWYWAADRSQVGGSDKLAGDRFVVACGQRDLWSRVQREIDRQEDVAGWMSFGPKSGEASLADCLSVFLQARERYGAAYNRVMVELAQVPAWAKFLHTNGTGYSSFVSAPLSTTPLPREPYDHRVEQQLRNRIQATLGLPDEA